MLYKTSFPSKQLEILRNQKKYHCWMSKISSGLTLLGISCILSACQSNELQKKVANSTQERPLILSEYHDGLQNIRWRITEIKGKKAQVFQQMPSLRLYANTGQLQGNTGCNMLTGRYELNAPRLTFEAKASYQRCDGALVQEAHLMDALFETRQYRLVGNHLQLINQAGEVVLMAQK